MLNLSNNAKVKILQASAYLGAILTLLFWWDTTLFLLAIVWGWLVTGFGSSICLHNMSAHRSFVPKNRAIKLGLLLFGTIASMGSTICWSDTHRLHHVTSDSHKDPHRPKGNWWHKIKMWFYYFPSYDVNPMRVKDLVSDKDHMWFHKNYYWVIASWVAVLALIDIKYAAYFYCVSMLVVFFAISWVTVLAHIPQLGYGGYRLFDSDDYTYNSHFWAWLLWGEGYHNTHHSNPGLYDLAVRPGEYDYCARVIECIGIPSQRAVKPFGEPREGKALREEFDRVTERLESFERNDK
jgi:stearoyl-CoA desaturase (delta-9 desaturase)